MAPLSDTAKTALVARLRMARSGKRISEEKLVQPLANHLAGRGESVADLPWDVEYDVKESDEGWREEWLALLEEAKIESKLDCVRFIRWLQMPLTSGEKKTGAGGLAQVALEALESVGQVVPATSVAALERAMAASEAGSTQNQCVDNPALIGALYMGKSSLSQDSTIHWSLSRRGWRRWMATLSACWTSPP